MTTASTISVRLILDTTDYNKNVKDAKTKTKDMTDSGKSGSDAMGKSFEKMTGISLSMAGVVSIAGAAVLGLVKYMGEAEKAAVESAKADAKVNAVLASTNYQAGMTSDTIDSLATSLSKSAGIDDELVKSAEAVLLTFTKISSDVFPRTMQAAADMNAVIGSGEGSLQTYVTMIGKAMNDFSGYTAMKKAGVSFTEEQIAQIANFKETNDLVGYQQLLLKELETEYGDAAKKINSAGDGSENLKVALGNLKEKIGAHLIPAQREWNGLMTDTINALAGEKQKIDSVATALKRNSDEYTAGTTSIDEYYNRAIEGGIENNKMIRVQEQHWLDYLNAGGKVSDMTGLQAVQFNYLVSKYHLLNAEQYDYLAGIEGGIEKFKPLTKVSQAWADSLTAQAEAYRKLHPEIIQTDEEIKAITAANEEYIKGVQTWQSMITSYSENMASLTEKQAGLESDLAAARAQGYSDQGEKIQGILSDMDDVNTAIEKEKKAYELKTKTVILGYMQEKLAADGNLDDKETAWLIAKGVEWGIYSQDAVKAYEDASRAADDFLKHRQASEYDNTITVTTVYNSISSTVGGSSSVNPATTAAYSSKNLRAYGGTTLAQQMYQVTETGKPELLTVGNDNYLIMGDQNGAVTPMDNSKEPNIVKPTVKDSSANNRELARMFAEELRPFLK